MLLNLDNKLLFKWRTQNTDHKIINQLYYFNINSYSSKILLGRKRKVTY